MRHSFLLLALLTASAAAQAPEWSTIRLLVDDVGVPVEVRRAVAVDGGWLVVGTTRADTPQTVVALLDPDLELVESTAFSSILPTTPITDFAAALAAFGTPYLAALYTGSEGESDRIAVFRASAGKGAFEPIPLVRVEVSDALGPGRRVSHLAAVREVPCPAELLCPLLLIGTTVAADDSSDEDSFAIVATQSITSGPRSLLAPTPDVRDGLLAADVGPDGRVVLGGYVRQGAPPTGPAALRFLTLGPEFNLLAPPELVPTAGGPLRIAEIAVDEHGARFVASAEFERDGERLAIVFDGSLSDDGVLRDNLGRATWNIPEHAAAVRAERVIRRGASAPFVVVAGDDAEAGVTVLLAVSIESGLDGPSIEGLGDLAGLRSLAVGTEGRWHLEGAPAQDGGTSLWVRDVSGVLASTHEEVTLTLDGGGIYRGETRDGMPHGRGGATFPNGNHYEGAWADGQMHGQGIFTYADGGVYVGSFVEGRLEGHGRMAYADGGLYEGEFRDWLWHGEGALTYANGERYVGTYVDREMSGHGRYTWPGGTAYEGEFAGHAPNGRGRKTYPDGGFCVGTFVEWNREGPGRCTFANGDVFEGDYAADFPTEGVYTPAGQAPRPARWDGERWVWTGPPQTGSAPSGDWSWEAMIAADFLPTALEASASAFLDLRGDRIEARGGDSLWASVYQPQGRDGQDLPMTARIEYVLDPGTTKLYLSGPQDTVGLMMTIHEMSKRGLDHFVSAAGLDWPRTSVADPDQGVDAVQYSECGGERAGRVVGVLLRDADPGFARHEVQMVRFDPATCSDGR